jgi:hypothetical protein
MSLPSDFGYDPYTTALYLKETGRRPPAEVRQDGFAALFPSAVSRR